MSILKICATLAASFILAGSATAGFVPVRQKVVPNLYIVLIASADYINEATIPRLNSPVKDVEMLGRAFQALSGRLTIGRLEVLINSPRARILEAIADVASAAKAAEATTLIYWNGHSLIDIISNTLTLIPVDAQTNPSASAATGMSVLNGIDFVGDVLKLFHRDQRLVFVGDSCYVGEALVGKAAVDWPNLVVLSASKSDEVSYDGIEQLAGHGPLAYFVAEALQGVIEDHDGDGLISIDDLFMYVYPRTLRAMRQSGKIQHPAMFGRFSHRTMLAVARQTGDDGKKLAMKLDPSILSSLTERSTVTINGDPLNGPHDIRDGVLWIDIKDAPKAREGMNLIEILPQPSLKDVAKAFNLWREANELQPITLPYKRSHAIVIAIGDYKRGNDPLNRGPTRLDEVGRMVSTARELASVLRNLGFETIHELYDHEATSANIEALLKTYWRGEGNDGVDRLFIYFGAHGIPYEDSAGVRRVLLATYDYDVTRERSTSFLASDLLERHSDNFAAQHAMFAIDACSAGFARTSSLNPEAVLNDAQVARIKKLQTFRDELEKKSRNVLVAGKDNQDAVTEEGSSIFALKLIDALRGKADPHNKGYWKFSDIQTYVKLQVSIAAKALRQTQQPTSWYLRAFGDGEMVFYENPQPSPQR